MASPYHLGLEVNVGMKLGMEQRLSPQMIQSLKLLQVTALQLETMVSEEMELNPLLEAEDEIQEKQPEEKPEPEPEKTGDAGGDEPTEEFNELKSAQEGEDINWEAFFEDGFDPGYRQSEDFSKSDNRLERVPVATKSLQDHLLNQLIYRHMDPKVRALVEYLIDSLDDDGYLRNTEILDGPAMNGDQVSPDIFEIQEVLAGKKEEILASRNVREAFNQLRSLEPPGIGARSLRECLLLQVNRLGNCSPLAKRLLEEEFLMVEKVKISAIAKKLDISPEEVQQAIREIGCLEPKPGRLLNESVSTPIIPDLLLEVIDGQVILMFNDKHIPSLRISKSYSSMLRKGSKATSEEKKYVRERLNSASWLIRAIEQRKSTMLKVMNAIIESQPEFFTSGPSRLKPLILQDIADRIKMHISTVSRVINGKYVQTPMGIFELKYFFTSGVAQENGSDVSSMTVKNEIKRLIDSEDSKKPLSDQRIADILKTRGFDVARRTVAKYRDHLAILPTRLRKQF